ncbi:39161_t:CDS:2, partial [Gigaspora margarita]
TAITLSNKEVGPNFFGKHTTENNNKDNINNIKSNKNMYNILLQEEGSSTKESWDDMVSQYESYLQANISVQEIGNRQNNNKEHMTKFNSESSGLLQHGSTDNGHFITDKDPFKTNLQVNEDQALYQVDERIVNI